MRTPQVTTPISMPTIEREPSKMSEDKVTQLAEFLNCDDVDGWHYKAIKNGSRSFVESYDEEGNYAGSL